MSLNIRSQQKIKWLLVLALVLCIANYMQCSSWDSSSIEYRFKIQNFCVRQVLNILRRKHITPNLNKEKHVENETSTFSNDLRDIQIVYI